MLISNGRVDPLVPVAETDRLAALLRSAGADVTLQWHQAGHQLVHDDIAQRRSVACESFKLENQLAI